MTPLEIALLITSGLSLSAGGVFGGLWWGQRNTSRVLERVYDHVRNRLPPLEDTPNRLPPLEDTPAHAIPFQKGGR